MKKFQNDDLCKNLFRNKKIFWNIIVIALLISIFFIVYFAMPGGNKQGAVGIDEANSNSGQGGDSQAGNNELNPTEQRQTEENPGIKRSSGVGAKILKSSLASSAGFGLATIGTYLYGKMSPEGKDPEKQKAQNGNKEKDDRSYACVDSVGKVVTKTEEKNISNNMDDVNTDVSGTEQSLDFDDAEKS